MGTIWHPYYAEMGAPEGDLMTTGRNYTPDFDFTFQADATPIIDPCGKPITGLPERCILRVWEPGTCTP